MHESLLNEITNLDKNLLNTEVSEVQERTAIKLIKDTREIVKRIRIEKEIPENNIEPKKREIKELKIERAQIGEFSTDDEEVE
jgi:hypothetical protein